MVFIIDIKHVHIYINKRICTVNASIYIKSHNGNISTNNSHYYLNIHYKTNMAREGQLWVKKKKAKQLILQITLQPRLIQQVESWKNIRSTSFNSPTTKVRWKYTHTNVVRSNRIIRTQ
jgi:hypothetical protein